MLFKNEKSEQSIKATVTAVIQRFGWYGFVVALITQALLGQL